MKSNAVAKSNRLKGNADEDLIAIHFVYENCKMVVNFMYHDFNAILVICFAKCYHVVQFLSWTTMPLSNQTQTTQKT